MVREIKFRAWIKSEKLMTDIQDLYSSGGGLNEVLGTQKLDAISYRKNKEAYRSEFEIMQYIGLKDINGMEIYERDILKVYREDEVINIEPFGPDINEGYSQIGIVEFYSCSFAYKTVKTIEGKHEEIHLPIDWLDEVEVIGNTYENPELLEVS